MDVICQNCGTEYDFDETLVSERGTTVKCTQCAHLFKVYRPGGGDARPWSIRHRDGREELVPTLRDLQKLIATGHLSEFDEIARQGDPFKPLGSIAELASFFSQARASRPDSSPPAGRPSAAATELNAPRRVKGTLMGYMPNTESVVPPQVSQNQLAGAPSQPPEAPRVSAPHKPASVPPPPLPPPSVPPPPSVSVPAPAPVAPRPLAKPAEPERANPAAAAAAKASHRAIAATRAGDMLEEPVQAPVMSKRPPLVEDDDDDVKGIGSPKWGRWIALLVIVGLGVGAYVKRDLIMAQVAALQGPPPDLAAPFLSKAEEALRRDDAEGYREGIHEMIRATAVAERDPRVLTLLSRAYSLKSQLHEFDAQDLVAVAGEDPARLAEAAGLRHVARDAAQEARHKAEDAVREAPDSVDARVALADALRLTGDLIGARRHYERSLDLAPTASADQLTVGALLAAAEQDDLGAAVELAQQAVGADAGLIRARVVLARALLASGNGEAARAHVAHVLASQADHAGALAVRRRLDGEAPQPATADEVEVAPTTAAVDAGTAAPAPTTGTGTPGTATQMRDDRTYDEMTGTTRPPGTGTPVEDATLDDGRPPEGRDYSWYIQNGDTALSGGNLSRADAFYQAALETRPGSSEATTGLANVLLRRGRAEDAVTRFRAATRQGYGPAFIGLGRANEALGRRSEAIQAYEDYLSRSSGGSLAATARQRLEALRPSAAPTPAPGGTDPVPAPLPDVEPTPGPT